MPAAETWLYPTPAGLFCEAGQFFVDPHRPVDRALITHGHSDHARAGHGSVLATAETIAIMQVRMTGTECAGSFEAVNYGEARTINGVAVRFVPAGHILGPPRLRRMGGVRLVVSGDISAPSTLNMCPF